MWPGFESWHQRHMRVEFVVGSLLCSERFFSGYSGFPLSKKNQHFQIPIRSGTHGHVSASSYELLSAPWVKQTNYKKKKFNGRQHHVEFVVVLALKRYFWLQISTEDVFLYNFKFFLHF